jgi:superfamily I DNA/RNA helicase
LSAFGGKKALRKKVKAYEAAWARLQADEPGPPAEDRDIEFEAALLSWLRFHRAMLIGEVIPETYRYLNANPVAEERTEYSHILVDEFQDLNRVEQRVIELLSDEAEVCVVGDDDQSIYSFKHAHPEGIQTWHEHNEEAADLALNVCRRCPVRVVSMANSLISRNQLRPINRQLVPHAANGEGDVSILQYGRLEQEVEGVADTIQELIDNGVEPGSILVLAQRGVIGTPIYEQLRARGIPTKSYYAEAELEGDEAQLRFAVLKLAADPEDRVALRWLVGLGSQNWYSGGYRRVRQHCENSGLSPWAAMSALSDGTLTLPHTAPLVQNFNEIAGSVEELRAAYEENGIEGAIDFAFPEGDDRWRDLRELAQSLAVEHAEEENFTLSAFVGALTYAIAKPEIPSEVQDVRIMSLHKSKGLSSPVTFIAGCVQGLIPGRPDPVASENERRAALEEDRRLFFVGITRVKAAPEHGEPGRLILTYSRRMTMAQALGAGISPAQIVQGDAIMHASQFLGELGPAAPEPHPG